MLLDIADKWIEKGECSNQMSRSASNATIQLATSHKMLNFYASWSRHYNDELDLRSKDFDYARKYDQVRRVLPDAVNFKYHFNAFVFDEQFMPEEMRVLLAKEVNKIKQNARLKKPSGFSVVHGVE